jgi:acyl-CoA thioester hydrolase
VTPDDDSDPRTLTLDDFPVRWAVTTRWADNDMFGHLNNAVHYGLFDTAINGWLVEQTGVDPVTSSTPGVVAESGCRYLAELGFPEPLTVGLAVTRLGRSSVTYQLGLFGAGQGATAAAVGHWVHVYIDHDTRRPTAIPGDLRSAMEAALVTRG